MNNKFKTLIAIILLMAIFSSGTFAWINFKQTKTNEWYGDKPPGGTTHDDFGGGPKKDIYIENWGGVTLFVRIRLDEYMEIGEGAGLKGTFNSGVWTKNPDNKSAPLISGANIDNKITWTSHIPAAINTPDICKPNGPAGSSFHDYWTWSMGGQKYYKKATAADKADPTKVAQDTNVYNPADPDVALTLNATVITMAQWIANGKNIGPYWVIDTDGWAYWAAPLAPNTATGLLLNNVALIDEIDNSYYYAIHITAQMATKNTSGEGDFLGNYEDFYSGIDSDHTATTNGKELLSIIVNG